ncbi:hypothetical protein HYG77_32540 (plasmid) [Rhodococcus sp. ZPP]|uniref:hypothetical protein n=1 Tax=Rhodococcus sp. ZPP TaxID=2749906 RepID=UPI001AD864F2|nr:hypothetical protein [Rhodococcus sp. ZPP]QTJ70291.1 hypothetical protein HYG77_32540 [Rhodococcus sp. ZPP]
MTVRPDGTRVGTGPHQPGARSSGVVGLVLPAIAMCSTGIVDVCGAAGETAITLAAI